MKKSIKISIIICVIIALVLIVLLVVVNNNKPEYSTVVTNHNQVMANIIENTPIANSRKMSKYIDILSSNNYYMKTQEKSVNENGETETLTTENAVTIDKMVINYEEKMTTLLMTKEATYYMLHENRILQKYSISEGEQAGFSGFNMRYSRAFFEQNFKGTGTEDIEDIPYYYEEYSANLGDDSKIRYYFDNNDQLIYIKNITKDGQTLTEVIELSDNIRDELFERPQDYMVYDISNIAN